METTTVGIQSARSSLNEADQIIEFEIIPQHKEEPALIEKPRLEVEAVISFEQVQPVTAPKAILPL